MVDVSFCRQPSKPPPAVGRYDVATRFGMSLRSLARDYDETAEDLEVGASEIRHPELLTEEEN